MKAGGAELGEAHNSVLASSDPCEQLVGIGAFFPYTGNKAPTLVLRPSLPVFLR
jgi:hypothetical protein